MSTSLGEIEHIAIVGAGIAGCHAAQNLASDYDVTIFDRSGIAAEATGYMRSRRNTTSFTAWIRAVT
ncbi:FAD-dependent oxidoreductase [Salinadaptatus halalkaliphilus]|uniref:FAD-dependent oxidoreductase n=1 Tax=Salinadaptatus halalkaliphilus TaxID=2419781 RepID=A0A4S3THN0_9EURY|nr:FAD-dependent oxidoreductase [Salinadaptatus halalkaliphilus]THE63431.1 FAD-dependent oxidoreductase [Salinadaptatus halalkaliphilus]